jgi:hypothetical protein
VNELIDKDSPRKVRNLSEAIRRVRTGETSRSDVVVDLRDAEKARLDLLCEELKEVFADVPADNETFLFSVAENTPLRLWIDMTSFVAMGRDHRTFRFLKDTRLGRTIILETNDIADMADCVTNYVAERIIEREQAMEGDWLIKRVIGDEPLPEKSSGKLISGARYLYGRPNFGWAAATFLFGVLTGVLVLFAAAWILVD